MNPARADEERLKAATDSVNVQQKHTPLGNRAIHHPIAWSHIKQSSDNYTVPLNVPERRTLAWGNMHPTDRVNSATDGWTHVGEWRKAIRLSTDEQRRAEKNCQETVKHTLFKTLHPLGSPNTKRVASPN